MSDLTKAIVSTVLCALLGIAVAEGSTEPPPLPHLEHLSSVARLGTEHPAASWIACDLDPPFAQIH